MGTGRRQAANDEGQEQAVIPIVGLNPLLIFIASIGGATMLEAILKMSEHN